MPLDNTSFISDCEQFENEKVQIISFRFDKMRDISICTFFYSLNNAMFTQRISNIYEPFSNFIHI